MRAHKREERGQQPCSRKRWRVALVTIKITGYRTVAAHRAFPLGVAGFLVPCAYHPELLLKGERGRSW